MGGSQVFVGVFAIVSVALSVAAIWRVAKTPGVSYKALWMVGSLFGFVGAATSWSAPGDLYLEFGIQIPVIMILTFPDGGTILKTMFPFVAVAALVKCHSTSDAR
jgi:hypothetical protein